MPSPPRSNAGERPVKHQDTRKPAIEIGDEDREATDAAAPLAPVAWYQSDLRTRRLAMLVGSGYSYVTIEIVYAPRAQPELRQVATWEGFDIAPQFTVFHEWLAGWQTREEVDVVDLRASLVELVREQEIALNPQILFVH